MSDAEDGRRPAVLEDPARPDWGPLVVLGLAQFLMVLDQSVMNVSISQLVEDFDTDVTSIQAAITLYALVMAMLMLTGGKLGDIWGRRRRDRPRRRDRRSPRRGIRERTARCPPRWALRRGDDRVGCAARHRGPAFGTADRRHR